MPGIKTHNGGGECLLVSIKNSCQKGDMEVGAGEACKFITGASSFNWIKSKKTE